MSSRRAQQDIDDLIQKLLDSTERLFAAIVEDGEGENLDLAFDRREQSFLLLEAIDRNDLVLTAASRTCLSRIRSFDAEIIAMGGSAAGKLRGERRAVARRRSAIAAHTKRDRGEPRLLTVKA